MKVFFISIVVPALNSEKTMENCIRSLLNQKYLKNKYEIIIIDNNSTDNTLNIIKKFGKKIRFYREQKKGAYYARNTGVKHAMGDIIAFTDSDCIVDRNWLFYISEAFKDNSIKLVGGDIKAIKKSSVLLRYCDMFSHSQEAFSKSKIPFFASGNMAVRTRDFRDVGMFNSYLKSGGDLEFCSRLIKDSSEIFYEPKVIVKHNYEETLSEFIKKQFLYGKWHKLMRQNFRLYSHVDHPNYTKILRYNWKFLYFRILQDVSFKLGFMIGNLQHATTDKELNPR